MQKCIFFDFSFRNICVCQKKAVPLHAFSRERVAYVRTRIIKDPVKRERRMEY